MGNQPREFSLNKYQTHLVVPSQQRPQIQANCPDLEICDLLWQQGAPAIQVLCCERIKL